jgi:hypothetical protein
MRFICNTILLSLLLFAVVPSFGQSTKGYLRLVKDTANDDCGYINAKGDIVIPFGKYITCYTTKFYDFAIVRTQDTKTVGIDRKENILFDVFIFDNWPDPLSNGLFRIVKEGKIGYADIHGKIIIQPQFDGAYSFWDGKAKVGTGCKLKMFGEHSSWVGGTWYTIDTKGNKVAE